MRELALAGFVAVAFGLGSFYATNHFGVFGIANTALGGAALLLAAISGARRLRAVGGPHSRPVILRGLALIVAACALAVAGERLAAWSDVRFDWTFEKRYELADATVRAVEQLAPRGGSQRLDLLLFANPLDPRIRRTRYLLQTIARYGNVRVRQLQMDQVPKELDEYGVGSSNSVVVRRGQDFELVERPSEGTLYEALYRLESTHEGTLLLLRGEGEGDPQRGGDVGYSGFAQALVTEGYAVRSAVTSSLRQVPEDVDAVIAIAPRRPLRPESVDVLRAYLRRGGSLVAMLEPGVETGLEPLLSEWGIEPEPGLLVDPASGEESSHAEGLCPVAYSYEQSPVTRGLDRNRMTIFCGVRTFRLRKREVEDDLRAVVESSPHAWVSPDLSLLSRRSGRIEPPPGVETGYHPIAVAGRFERKGVETRILAFGDADFASNRLLRAIYNLDLAVNGVHWAVQRESRITLRPKIRSTIQFPLPLQNSLRTLYGVGLLLPEILIIAGGVVWLRRRSA